VVELESSRVPVVPAEDATAASLVDEETLHATSPSSHVLAAAALTAISVTRDGSDPEGKPVVSAVAKDLALI
jgi:hypothetical protein